MTRSAPPDARGLDTDRRPFVLAWELTQACDLACAHCRADARPERHPDELTTDEGRALLDDAARFGHPRRPRSYVRPSVDGTDDPV